MNNDLGNTPATAQPNKSASAAFAFGKCQVCKDRATGIHYGVATCEGCKGFFKRGLTKSYTYVCYFGNKCVMTPKQRKKCKLCRWKSCLASGMAFEGIKMGRISKLEKERAKERVTKTETNETSVEEKEQLNKITAKNTATYNNNSNDHDPVSAVYSRNATMNLITIANLIRSSTSKLISSGYNTRQLLPHKSYTDAYLDTPCETKLIILNLLRDRSQQLYSSYMKSLTEADYQRARQTIRQTRQETVAAEVQAEDDLICIDQMTTAMLQSVSAKSHPVCEYIGELPGFAQLHSDDLNFLLKHFYFLVYGLLTPRLFIDDEFYTRLPGDIQFTKRRMRSVMGAELTDRITDYMRLIKRMQLTETELALLVPCLLTSLNDKAMLKDLTAVRLLNDNYKKTFYNELTLNNRKQEFLRNLSKLVAESTELNDILRLATASIR